MYYLIKGTVTQIEKALINDCLRVSKKVFLKSSLLFNSFYCLFCLQKKLYVLNNLKTRKSWMQKFECFFICIETIIICYEIICMTVPQPRGQRHFLYVCNLRKVKVRVVHPATYNFSISTAIELYAIEFFTIALGATWFEMMSFLSNVHFIELKPAFMILVKIIHCVKSFHVWSYSGSYFPEFGLNTERYLQHWWITIWGFSQWYIIFYN